MNDLIVEKVAEKTQEVERDERANEVEEAKPSPPNGGGGGSDAKPEEAPRAIGLPRAPILPPAPKKKKAFSRLKTSLSPNLRVMSAMTVVTQR